MWGDAGQLYGNDEALYDIMWASVINLRSLHYTSFNSRAV